MVDKMFKIKVSNVPFFATYVLDFTPNKCPGL